MNIQRLGSQEGSWWVDLDEINRGSFVIDAGVGIDISFAEELIRLRGCNVIGVDPSYKSLKYVAEKKIVGYSFVLGAISPRGAAISMFYGNEGSESYCNDHPRAKLESYKACGVSLTELIKTFAPELVKLDIEGMEYHTALEAVGVRQVCIEFHHRIIPRFSASDTAAILNTFQSQGYKIIHRTDLDEVTLLL